MKKIIAPKFEKGMYISPTKLSEIFETPVDDSNFPLKVLGAKCMIETENPELTCKIQNKGILILHDNEASEYNTNQFMLAFSIMDKRHSKMLTVNTANFSDVEKTTHERRAFVMGKIVSAAKDEARKHIPEKRPIIRSLENNL